MFSSLVLVGLLLVTPKTLHVSHVIDGDTIALTDGRRIRLAGVAAPEWTTRHDCFGEDAATALRELFHSNAEVVLEPSRQRKSYGRTVAYPRLVEQDLDVGLFLISTGFARNWTRQHARSREYAAAQRSAQEHLFGLWAECEGPAAVNPHQCLAFTKVGTRCARARNVDAVFCWQHMPKGKKP